MADLIIKQDHVPKKDQVKIYYLTKGDRTRQVPDEDAQNAIPTKDGVWFDLPVTETNGMFTLTCLCLLGGRREEDGAGWPMVLQHALTFVGIRPEDATDEVEHVELFYIQFEANHVVKPLNLSVFNIV